MNKFILLLSAAALVALSGCSASEAIAVASTIQADWSTDASSFRGQDGTRHAFVCPPGGRADTVWGTNPSYTDDSSVCTAAVHAGAITFARGGRVVIQISQGLASYAGSTANGVETQEYGSWGGSFRVVL